MVFLENFCPQPQVTVFDEVEERFYLRYSNASFSFFLQSDDKKLSVSAGRCHTSKKMQRCCLSVH